MLFEALLLASVASKLASAASSGGVDPFVPVYIQCPQNLTIRPASQGLSQSEQTWRQQRGQNVMQAVKSYLQVANVTGLDVNAFTSKLNSSNAPVAGLAISGGGTQSGMGGFGIWRAFDSREPQAVAARTGGLTQILTYLTGLSGGGCVTVASLAANNFTTIENLRQTINFSVNYEEGPGGNVTQYYTQIFENVGAKAEAGFPVSVVDAFGQFWNTYLPKGGLYSNYSDLAEPGNAFSSGNAPMPILVFAEVVPGVSPSVGGILYPGPNATNLFNLTSYEVNPYEFGSWAGGRVQAFMPTKYVGSQMNNGSVQNSSQCVQGFDKYTFVQGTTANAFCAYLLQAFYGILTFAKRSLNPLLSRQSSSGSIYIPPSQYDNPFVQLVNATTEFGPTFNQSLWSRWPNPFQNYNEDMKDVSELLLVDGSLTGETDPIRPLIIPARGVDFIIVFEASSDAEYNWVNGTNLVDTSKAAALGNIPFPQVPDAQTFVSQNLSRKPSFFGCEDSTGSMPLVLYLPNSPWSGYLNYTYTMPSFTPNQMDLIMENAFQLATFGNGTIDAQWPECLACATIRGSARKMGFALPDVCNQCFERHCWNGTSSPQAITEAEVDPTLWLNSSLSYQVWNTTVWNKQSSSSGSTNGSTSSSATSGAGHTMKKVMRHTAYPVVLGFLHLWQYVM